MDTSSRMGAGEVVLGLRSHRGREMQGCRTFETRNLNGHPGVRTSSNLRRTFQSPVLFR